MATTSESQIKANAKYDAANTKRFGIKLNTTWDEDIIMFLESGISKQTIIKLLIREYIAERRTGVNDAVYAKFLELKAKRDGQ